MVAPEGGMCKVRIDASEGVARVIFENSNYLGIEWDSRKINEVITIPEGEEAIIPIYNGAENGPLTFDISFSGAKELLAGATALAIAVFTM